jgi:AbiV family abortive infection protein
LTEIEKKGVSLDAQGSDQAPLDVLIRGAAKTFENAEHLFLEAKILADGGAVARALCLHQISLEECSKVNNLCAWALSLFSGLDVDQKKVLAAFGSHAAKNKSNAYMLEGSEAEMDAIACGNWQAALAEFRHSQDEFHKTSNQAKNASLYVDWVDGEFVAPSERITKEVLAEITERNVKFLGYACHHLKLLKRLEKAPDTMRDLFSGFVEWVEKLREEKPADASAFETLMWSFLEEKVKRK